MKEAGPALARVRAVIRAQQLDAVVERLLMIGVRGLIIREASGSGSAAARVQVFRGSTYEVPFAPQVTLDWYGPADEADAVVRAIQQRAHTGEIGDGRIFVERAVTALRIRTGERGLDAL